MSTASSTAAKNIGWPKPSPKSAKTRVGMVDLSRFRAAPDARLGHFPFEGDGAFPTQCRVPSARTVEAVDVVEGCHLCCPSRWPRLARFKLWTFQEKRAEFYHWKEIGHASYLAFVSGSDFHRQKSDPRAKGGGKEQDRDGRGFQGLIAQSGRK